MYKSSKREEKGKTSGIVNKEPIRESNRIQNSFWGNLDSDYIPVKVI